MRKKNYKIGIYFRNASSDQHPRDFEVTPDSQIKSVLQYIRSSSLSEVVAIHKDYEHSGLTSKRPGFQALLHSIHTKEIDLVVVSDLTRLARSMEVLEDFFEAVESAQCDFYSIKEDFYVEGGLVPMILPCGVEL